MDQSNGQTQGFRRQKKIQEKRTDCRFEEVDPGGCAGDLARPGPPGGNKRSQCQSYFSTLVNLLCAARTQDNRRRLVAVDQLDNKTTPGAPPAPRAARSGGARVPARIFRVVARVAARRGAARADIEASVGTATRFGANVEPPRVGARVAARNRARGATLARVRSVACVHTVSYYI